MCLAICLLFGCGCAHDPHRPVYYKNIKVVPGAVRTVCIQPDPTQPEMALVVKPLEEELTARGYKIMATPEEAVHTIRLHLTVFGTELKERPGKGNAPGMMEATGTVVGGAVSGNALHAATTTGGAAGGLAGLVLGGLLNAGSSKGPFFYAGVDVRISDLVSGEQHTIRGMTWKLLKDPNDPKLLPLMQKIAGEDLANKVAELMP
jgi:hypothetical protein